MGYSSSLITSMDMKHAATHSSTFGPWMEAEVRSRSLTQAEFARRMGVSQSTVSRWYGGRLPDARFIDRIADVLVLDYDAVATRAGYRPRGLGLPDPIMAEIEPKIRKIDWGPPHRLKYLHNFLDDLLEEDSGN